MAARSRWRWRLAVECVIVIALVAASVWYGRFAFRHAVAPPDYYYLAPAIMVASGQGFQNPTPLPGSPLEAFLARRVEQLAVSEAAPASLSAPDAFQGATRYLLLTVGYWWRYAGISWANVGDVAAGLHAVAVMGAYALVRLFLPLPFAVAGALWICTSTLQLSFVPHIRDYSKAAFIVAALPLVVALALRAGSRPALLAAAAACGAVIGIGFGFRMDTAIMVPLAVMAVWLFRGERPWRGWLDKSLATVAFLVALAIPAWPVISQLSSGGSNESHVVLLGYADSFDTNLEIDPSVYRFMPFYSDGYVATTVAGYAASFHPGPLAVPSPEYAAATRRLWLEIVFNFPADVYARALAATGVVMNLAFHSPDPSFLAQALPARDVTVRVYQWLQQFSGLGVPLGIALILVASAISVRHGALATLLLLVLAGYPSLQFSDRHYFHVQVIPVFAILVMARVAIEPVLLAIRRLWPVVAPGEKSDLPEWRDLPHNLAVGAGIVAIVTVVPLGMLRLYQSAHVERAIQQALDGGKTPVAIAAAPSERDSWLVAWPQEPAAAAGQPQASYYVLEFADDTSGAEILVGLQYATADPGIDYSRTVSVTPAPGTNRLGFSVLTVAGHSSFAGIEMGPQTKRRLTAAYRLDAGPAGLPIDLVLPADWQRRSRFQRLAFEARWRGDYRTLNRTVVCATGPGCRGLMGLADRAGEARPDLEGVTVHSPAVQITSGAITADGLVENDSSYLVQLRDRRSPAGSAFVATGRLGVGGGAVIGLLNERRWYRQAFVNVPGAFLAVVPIDQPGEYAPLLTNAMPAGRRYNQLVIEQAGFLDPPPQ